MPLLSWTDTDRLTDDSYYDQEYTRLSDYTQLLDAIKSIEDWFAQDHDGDTGAHLNGPYFCDSSDSISGSAAVETDTLATGASAGDITWSIPASPVAGGSFGGFYAGANGADGGMIELLHGYDGGLANGIHPAIGAKRLTVGSSNPGLSYTVKRLAAWSPECISSVYSDYIATPASDDLGPADVNTERTTRARFTYRSPFAGSAGRAVSKSLYRQCWRLAKSVSDAIKYEHNTSGASFKASLMRLYGRVLADSYDLTDSEAFASVQAFPVCAHGGENLFVLPWARFLVEGTASYPRWIMAPAFDDTTCYVAVQPAGHSTATPANWEFTLRAVAISDETPAVGTLVALDTTTLATQSYNIRPSEWQQIWDGLDRYRQLYEVEHDLATGGHRYPISRMPGATLVYDDTVTANAADGVEAYVASGTAYAASQAIGTYETVELESIPVGGGVYLASLVGAAGSGVVQATIAVDDAKAYLVLRRLTTGTSNTFTAKVWRIDP